MSVISNFVVYVFLKIITKILLFMSTYNAVEPYIFIDTKFQF